MNKLELSQKGAVPFWENDVLDWKIDELFIRAALRAAEKADVVSFDVFDTAITRGVDSPIDVFAVVEKNLLIKFGDKTRGFAAAREEAEMRARESTSAEDITLAQIYAELYRTDFRPFLADARDAELAAEYDLSIGVPDVVHLAHKLEALDKNIIFVSDMYLPGAFVKSLLAKAGYSDHRLFISSETLATKTTGSQWGYIRRYAETDTRFLHIGDDQEADVIRPKHFGIETMCYPRARSERRKGAKLTPAILPFSFLQRRTVLRARSGRIETNNVSRWQDFGAVYGGLIVGSFIKWLSERAAKHKIRRLYFCARDGLLMKRAWDAADLSHKTGIEATGLYVSRRTLNLACGYLEGSPCHVAPFLREFITSGHGRGVSLERMLQRAGLETCHGLRRDLQTLFGDLRQHQIDQRDGRFSKIHDLLNLHAAEVHESLRGEFEALSGYLGQMDIGRGGRDAIVDMGWAGTMQAGLRSLLTGLYGPVKLAGFYYGLFFASATGNRFAAGLMESAFASDFSGPEGVAEIFNSVEILEELHSTNHGTVQTYRKDADSWKPVFAESPIETRQFEEITRHFQDGVIATVERYFRDGARDLISTEDFSPAAGISAIGAVGLSPSREEINLLSKIVHCGTYDHTQMRPILRAVPPETIEDMKRAMEEDVWRPGTLRVWLDETSGETRADVLKVVNETLGYLDQRRRLV